MLEYEKKKPTKVLCKHVVTWEEFIQNYMHIYLHFFINLFLLVNNVLQCTSKPQKDGMKKQNSIEKKARH